MTTLEQDEASEAAPGGAAVWETERIGEPRATGALEEEVMAFLWSVGEPVTPADVHQTLVPDLAYTTVMTILTRLWQKGLLARERAGRAYAYRPVRSEADHRADEMRSALERSSDRAAVLSSFMDALDVDDAEFLERFVKRGRRARRRRPDPHLPQRVSSPWPEGHHRDAWERSPVDLPVPLVELRHRGTLVGVPGRDTFGEIDVTGLLELPTEDCATFFQIGGAIPGMGDRHFVFGRDEPANQHLHRTIAQMTTDV